VSDPTTNAPGPSSVGEDWVDLSDGALPVLDAYRWAVRPDCGAVVMFTGTARDHSEGRSGVTELTYEAYRELAVPRMAVVVAEMRDRWPAIGRVAVLHRVGDVAVGQEAVLVVVSAPHRDEAFTAARYAIDAVKASVPIWKQERWDGGEDWGIGAQDLLDAAQVDAAQVDAAQVDGGRVVVDQTTAVRP